MFILCLDIKILNVLKLSIRSSMVCSIYICVLDSNVQTDCFWAYFMKIKDFFLPGIVSHFFMPLAIYILLCRAGFANYWSLYMYHVFNSLFSCRKLSLCNHSLSPYFYVDPETLLCQRNGYWYLLLHILLYCYCRYIIIRWIPILVVFLGTSEPPIQMFNKLIYSLSIDFVSRDWQNHEIKYPRKCKFSSIHKIDTHENKWIHSTLY